MEKSYLKKLQETGNEIYFEAAENDAKTMYVNYIKPHVPTLKGKTMLEIACGHGRNTNQIIQDQLPSKIILVDINADNINFCKERFSQHSKILSGITNNGTDLSSIASGSVDFVFSFDSMVHFNQELVTKYIHEISRVLNSGGTALIHFSNWNGKDAMEIKGNPGLRGCMTNYSMLQLLISLRLDIIHNELVDWDNTKDLDGIVVFKKRQL